VSLLEKEPDPREVEQRVRECLNLAPIVVRQVTSLVGANWIRDELESTANEALWLAARSYDPSRGVPFKRWAQAQIRHRLYDTMRKVGGVPRRVYRNIVALQSQLNVEVATMDEDAAKPAPSSPDEAEKRLEENLQSKAVALGMAYLSRKGSEGLDEAVDQNETAEERVASDQVRERVRVAIERLDEPGRSLVARYYLGEESLDDISLSLGLKKSWASRLMSRAVGTLAHELRGI
jgi:RNA polymerase sigma factor FliA